MAIVRHQRTDIDVDQLLVDYYARPEPTEEQIEAWAAEDGDAWTDEDFARASVVYPPPSAEEVRALRERLSLSQKQFADRFGFRVETIQQYEQGRRAPSGPATTLLRVIAADPEAVQRALMGR
jgi:putative transcriptional regulator